MATAGLVYEFGPFRLDPTERELSYDGKPVNLTDKVFELLLLLVSNRGRTLTKTEIMAKLWPDTVVEENNLTVNVSMLRKALGESASERRYVETLARRGYRFVAEVRAANARERAPEQGTNVAASRRYAATFVGREAELARLEQLRARAAAGRGRVVFITGSAGMGKTELCEQLLLRAHASNGDLFVGSGHCLEHYGIGEAYLPFLEALRALLSGPYAGAGAALLKRHAPTWCAQFPAALAAADPASASAAPEGGSPARMLRELQDALVALSEQKPVVLVLEDLHWADPSSSDLLHFLGQRIGRARVLLLGTMRAEQVELTNHPLKNVKRELLAHDQCDELALPLLEAPYIARYLDARLHQHALPAALADLIFRTTEGQPLFATRLVQLLIDRGDIRLEDGRWTLTRDVSELHPAVPENVRGLIQKKLESLSEAERRALQYASVAGVDFTSATLAALLREDEMVLEERLDQLARTHRLVELMGEERPSGGRLTVRYRFAHVLYQNVLYESLASKRKMALHGQVAEALLAEHGSRSERAAAQLALHFKSAKSFARAIEYSMLAADNASRLHANREAKQHYAEALALVPELPAVDQVAAYVLLHYNQGWTHSKVGAFAESIDSFQAMLDCASAPAFTGDSPEAKQARDTAFAYLEAPWSDAFGLSELARMPNQPRSLGASAVQCEAYWGMIYILLCTRRWDEMGVRASEFLRLAEAADNEPRRVEAQVWLALYELERRSTQQAARLLDDALPRARAMGHARAMCLGLHARGHIHHLRSEYETARAIHVEALEYAFEAVGRIWSLFGVGFACAKLGRVGEALRSFGEGLEIEQHVGHPRSLQTLANANGSLLLALGAREQALSEHARALEVARAEEDILGQAQARVGLASGYLASGELERAAAELELGERALEGQLTSARSHSLITAKRGHVHMAVDATWAEYWLMRGNLDSAEQRASALLAGATECGAPCGVALARRALGRVWLERGELERAEQEAQAGLAALAGVTSPFRELELRVLLAGIQQRAGAIHSAAHERARAQELVDGVARSVPDPALLEAWRGRWVRELA